MNFISSFLEIPRGTYHRLDTGVRGMFCRGNVTTSVHVVLVVLVVSVGVVIAVLQPEGVLPLASHQHEQFL